VLAMAINLTSNAISMICTGQIKGDDVNPVLQVVDLKQLNAGSNQNSAERYRVVLSDGFNSQQGMLATQMNFLVQSNKLKKGSVVELSQFVSQFIQNRQ
ncbi:Replication protein a subunit, partial [Thalictrum thalictroides]